MSVRTVAVLAAVATVAGVGAFVIAPAAVAAPTSGFTAITPTRLVDTRSGQGGLSSGQIPAGTSRPFDVNGEIAPLDAAAYVFNVTAVDPASVGNLRIQPHCSDTVPANPTSLVNFQAGKTVANDIVISNRCGSGFAHRFDVFIAGSATNVLIDAQGYYSGDGAFVGGTPMRLTSEPDVLNGSFYDDIVVAPPSNDQTPVALNVTAANPSGGGNLRVYGAGTDGDDPPNSSNINYIPGVDKAAFVVVTPRADGTVSFASAAGDNTTVGVLVDLFGQFSTISMTTNVAPYRAIDTRSNGGPLAANSGIQVAVTGGSGVPSDATAVIVSLTAIHVPGRSSGIGNLRAYPAGVTEPPTVSNVNYVSPNVDIANLAYVPVSGGAITVFTAGSTIDLAVDVVGYVTAG